MKNLKPYGILLCMTLGLISCEQDALIEVQPSETKNLSAVGPFGSQEDFEAYVAGLKKSKTVFAVNKAVATTGTMEVSSTYEAFSEICSEITSEDFSAMQSPLFFNTVAAPLTSNADTGFFKGEIIDGVSISSESEILALLNYANYESQVYTTSAGDVMSLKFPEGVNALGLKLFNLGSNDKVVIEVYNDSEMLEEISSFSYAFNEMFIGINSQAKFNSVKIYSEKYTAWIGLDEISFGSCSVDADGDGCLDDEDLYPYSNMEDIINIGDCSTGISNQITSECGVMMSDLIDSVLANSKNHGSMVSAITKLTKSWVAEGLINNTDKGKIIKCAGNFSE